ncbi:Lrp/AsnC family transcriptional regulator [Tsukamurella tyrosinosolvens]|uniref:Lrp/AsnC family transcriptional regulator n=1 Tax=Tsukamurella tyrosinosolvens TaxID=57704 RepID=UPI000C7EC969|nr:Lrp/AsnC family transcriptional regulator [Tsukamurella tyrosinosolvens]AUN41823.1 AsnC family transcriptional regulator [Tsukamurella tyrosinosolvens]
MPTKVRLDALDARILLALNENPRATVVAVAEHTGLARNTVQARINKLEQSGALQPFERRIDPAALGHPLSAFILTRVTQRKLDDIVTALSDIPQVIEVHGLGGVTDLLIHVVATEADNLYQVAGRILQIDGVEQTTTALVMRKFIDRRLTQLLG